MPLDWLLFFNRHRLNSRSFLLNNKYVLYIFFMQCIGNLVLRIIYRGLRRHLLFRRGYHSCLFRNFLFFRGWAILRNFRRSVWGRITSWGLCVVLRIAGGLCFSSLRIRYLTGIALIWIGTVLISRGISRSVGFWFSRSSWICRGIFWSERVSLVLWSLLTCWSCSERVRSRIIGISFLLTGIIFLSVIFRGICFSIYGTYTITRPRGLRLFKSRRR